MRQTFVTTLDNPYDFFTQFDEWYAFDTFKGYNTCGLVARLTNDSTAMSENERIQAINDAVDTIIRLNPTGNCRRVVKDDDESDRIEEDDE